MRGYQSSLESSGGRRPATQPVRIPPRAGPPELQRHLLPFAGVCCFIAIISTGILFGLIPSITLLTFFLASATAVFVLFRVGDDYDVMHPVRVFGAAWCFCLAVASMRLTTFITVWGVQMWAYVFIALAAFVAGFWLMSQQLHRKWHSSGFRPAQQLPKSEVLNTRRTLVIATVCLIIGVIALGYQYWQIGGIPIFAANIDEARTTFAATANNWSHPEFDTLSNKFVILFGIYCKYAAFLATAVLVQKTPKTRTQLIAGWLIILGALASLGSMGGRGFLVEYGVVAVALFHYLRRRIRLREISVAGLSLLVFLTVAGYWRSVTNNAGYTHDLTKRISNLPPGPAWDSMALGVQTLTSSFEVFNRLLQDAPELRLHSPGFLFYSLHRFVPRENIQELTSQLYSMETITPTFLGEFYLDFGGLGVLLGPLILGGVYGYVYSRALRYDSAYWLVIQGIFLSILVYFSYVDLFSQNVNWMWDMLNMAWLIWFVRTGKKERIVATSGRRIPLRARPDFGRASSHT